MNSGVDVIGNYEKYENKDYLRGCDLPKNGEDLVLTIKRFRAGVEVFDPGTRQNKEKFVIDFEEEYKPMILNKTNRTNIAKAIGTKDGEKWIGNQIAVYYDKTVKLGRETVGGLRVKPNAPKVEAAICESCGAEIKPHDSYGVNKIVTMSRAKYGQTLCWECAAKAKARKEAGNADA